MPSVLSPRGLVFRPDIGHKLYHHPPLGIKDTLWHLAEKRNSVTVNICEHGCFWDYYSHMKIITSRKMKMNLYFV